MRKPFTQDTHFFIYLIMQLATQFTQKMHYRLKIWIKDVEENNLYCAMDGLIKEMIALLNLWIF